MAGMTRMKKDIHPKGKTLEDKDLESNTLKDKASNGPVSESKTSEGKDPKNKASEGIASESNAPKNKTSEGNALGRTARPAGRAASVRRYTVACAVLGAVTAAGIAACVVLRDTWEVGLFFPLLGAVITALLWCSLVRLCLCRDPSRLLLRDFTRALRRALEVPVWAGVTVLLCQLPVEMQFDVAILLLTVFLAAVPVSALLGILSVRSAVRHLRAASPSEPVIYREGPLVLAVLLLIAELAALGWLVFYLLL